MAPMVPTRTTTDRRAARLHPQFFAGRGPALPQGSAWDGNGGSPRPALLPFSNEVTSMDSGSFFLFIVCMTLICLIWSRDDRRPQ